MKTIDLITILTIAYGILFVIVGLILFRRSRPKPKILPWLTGIGVGLYSFASLMTGSILQRPTTQIVDYTITDILLSLGFGVVGYIGGRRLANRFLK